jgi:hypothetical protein
MVGISANEERSRGDIVAGVSLGIVAGELASDYRSPLPGPE